MKDDDKCPVCGRPWYQCPGHWQDKAARAGSTCGCSCLACVYGERHCPSCPAGK